MNRNRYRDRRDTAFTVTWAALRRTLWAGVFFLVGVLAGQVLL